MTTTINGLITRKLDSAERSSALAIVAAEQGQYELAFRCSVESIVSFDSTADPIASARKGLRTRHDSLQPSLYQNYVAVVLALAHYSVREGVRLERTATLLHNLPLYTAKAGVDVESQRQSLLTAVHQKLASRTSVEPLELKV